MTELHTHRLDGCAPTPLASYLKALGLLRLLATAANNVKGEAADPAARGWWGREHFYLKTRLDRDALMRFFLEDYAPSPIIAPWNGRAGFLEGDDAEGSTREGAELMREIESSSSPRMASFRHAIQVLRREPTLSEYNGFRSRAKAAAKEEKENTGAAKDAATEKRKAYTKLAERAKSVLLPSIRATADIHQVAFLDACFVLSEDERAAPLLGSGGLDGSRDFGVNFARALDQLFSIQTGSSNLGTDIGLAVAIFGALHSLGQKQTDTMGQFGPGQGGANASTGFKGANPLNQWDIVLALEGTLLWSGALTRRWDIGSSGRAAFPFTFEPSRSGSGAFSAEDPNAPRGEIWTPLWGKPSSLPEIEALLSEGRLTLGRSAARTGLDAARAVAHLGLSRGIAAFERYSLIQPEAQVPYQAVPLGRFRTPERPQSDPIADLDAGHWLSRLRRAVGKDAPARARTAVRRLDDALFEIAREGVRPEGLQGALMELGAVVSWLTSSRKGREKVAPPPRLGRRQWVYGADDHSSEFRIAAALASLGWRASASRNDDDDDNEEAAPDSAPEGEDRGDASTSLDIVSDASADEASGRPKSPPPMAAHLAPVDEETVARRFRRWAAKDEKNPPGVVWGVGSLVQNMIAVLERRLIVQAVRGLDEKPLSGAASAHLSDVALFLEGPPSFDDARCAALLAGLVWAQPFEFHAGEPLAPIPFGYAALKPLFTPDDDLHAKSGLNPEARQFLSDSGKLPVPPGLLARLRRGATAEAIREALRRTRASGIDSPFNDAQRLAAGINPVRLAAALLIPIDETALTHLMQRAYPRNPRKEETDNAA